MEATQFRTRVDGITEDGRGWTAWTPILQNSRAGMPRATNAFYSSARHDATAAEMREIGKRIHAHFHSPATDPANYEHNSVYRPCPVCGEWFHKDRPHVCVAESQRPPEDPPTDAEIDAMAEAYAAAKYGA